MRTCCRWRMRHCATVLRGGPCRSGLGVKASASLWPLVDGVNVSAVVGLSVCTAAPHGGGGGGDSVVLDDLLLGTHWGGAAGRTALRTWGINQEIREGGRRFLLCAVCVPTCVCERKRLGLVWCYCPCMCVIFHLCTS